MRGVIDRFVDGKWAVILVGEEETEYNVQVEQLPMNVKESSVVQVDIVNGAVVKVALLEDETINQQANISKKMELLKARKRSNFKRE
jgi:transcriptional regulator of nitric oxide reductase